MATYSASETAPRRRARPEHGPEESGALIRVVAVLLGLAVGVLAIVGVVLLKTADDAKDEAANAAARVDSAAPAGHGQAHAAAATTSSPFTSYARVVPDNAEALAAAHKPYEAALPAAPAGPVANVKMTIKDMDVEIAPGVKYRTWAFDEATGTAPGPVIHVREGQTVEMTLVNGGSINHSIDFHAARIAPNVAFRDVAPGESFTFKFKAGDPGVYMYHCGTKPVLTHIANGMYGAIVVEPREKPLPKADREYVLVSSEWYLNSSGVDKPASFDQGKARAMLPDWVTWNGYADQYVQHPLAAKPGETVRFWVVAAGPSLRTDFHVVGTIFDRAWVNQDLTQYQRGVQTVSVPAGGGGVFDVKIDKPGLYPFVSHSFASVDLGQVGLLKVGNVKGSMSH